MISPKILSNSPLCSTGTPYGGNETGRAKRVSGVNIPKK
nr:MAG TPA: hypothetical protein [Caudoviricetes sp.]